MQLKLLPFLLIFALLNSAIELEISAPSFPDITQYFHISEKLTGLTISYNLFGFCLAALIYGPLSESFGRWPIMLIGNGILVIGAILCVIAPSIDILLLARFIQGVGAATSAVLVSAIIADSYRERQATKLYGIMNAVFTILMATAPSLGVLINSLLGWRGNYGVVATISLISWLLLCKHLPETKKNKSKLTLRKTVRDYTQLARSSLFLCAATIPSLFYGCYLAFIMLAPFIYMESFTLSMFTYAIHQAVIIGSFAFTSLLASKTTSFLGFKKTISTGLLFALAGSLLVTIAPNANMLTLAMSLFCIGFAIIYPPLFAYSLEIFPAQKGPASSLIMSLRYLLCACITGLASMVYDGVVLWFGVMLCVITAIIALLFSNLLSKLIANR